MGVISEDPVLLPIWQKGQIHFLNIEISSFAKVRISGAKVRFTILF